MKNKTMKIERREHLLRIGWYQGDRNGIIANKQEQLICLKLQTTTKISMNSLNKKLKAQEINKFNRKI